MYVCVYDWFRLGEQSQTKYGRVGKEEEDAINPTAIQYLRAVSKP